MDKNKKKRKVILFEPTAGDAFKTVIAILSVAFLLYIFTFYMDGEMGVILIAFTLFAPLISLFFAVYARKRVKVSLNCDGYVQKVSKLEVRVTVEKTGRFPLGIIEITPRASEVFAQSDKVYRISLVRDNKSSFTYTVDAVTGGNGEIALETVYSCGFLGLVRLTLTQDLPAPVSVGVIPDIPQIKASSQLFRSIADVVLTSDEEEENDTALMFSANTSPGYEHREYVHGDPMKRVNWKLSSKKDKLMVRLDEAVASVQPMIVLDLYRSSSAKPEEAILGEEQIIRSVFGLLSLLVKQGIASTLIYRSAGGDVIAESVDNPEYPEQLLLKVLAVKVTTDERVDLKMYGGSVCACVIASTDCGAEIETIAEAIDDRDNVSLIGISPTSRNLTTFPMWYLDGDNNFKLV
ncbi:Uncharacterized conserved protein, DUF58 family, contains vWF domain [Ruminococcus sp. YRD2003]|uniref:DUF58 domain-containing protein n=1 Tax=Ruminococcus sp. YRD2003 TaxID=1452313 RepID=UPI0008AC7162|nr:Uncharacterized conserved protein, DUF58 family, contains vWF domain [Ruminococcus flavefaciens]